MTSQKFNFISGLPRSGSTLTAAVLKQNPRFHAGISSPIASLFGGIISQVSAGNELASIVSEAQRERFLRGLFRSYYEDCEHDVIFDTNRSWTTHLPALMRVFPDAKLICLVRDVAWIMDSLERQFRKNAFENTRLFNSSAERATVYTRLDALANANRLVGFAWHALREACYSEFADRIVIVDYALLASRPRDVFDLLYGFIGEEKFDHDFQSVQFEAPEFDTQLGLDGLHRVHPVVEIRQRKSVLPPDLFEKYSNMTFWRDMDDSESFRIVEKT